MRKCAKKDGFATVPLLAIFLVFVMILMGVYIFYEESQRMIYRTDDAVTISLQGVCLFDRYEYATGCASGEEIVCFYPGINTLHYNPNDDAANMVVTKKACSFAYDLFLDVLLSNVSTNYVIVPAGGSLSNYVNKFEITNVYEDKAYIYDIISGTSRTVTPAAGLKSILTVEMGINMTFPLYGEKTVLFSKIGKLESRIN